MICTCDGAPTQKRISIMEAVNITLGNAFLLVLRLPSEYSYYVCARCGNRLA